MTSVHNGVIAIGAGSDFVTEARLDLEGNRAEKNHPIRRKLPVD